jgi:hypothetical protein
VRTQFRASIQAARNGLQTELKNAEKIGEQVKTLSETKRAAVRAAMDAFKATMEQARTELKAAFGTTEVQ